MTARTNFRITQGARLTLGLVLLLASAYSFQVRGADKTKGNHWQSLSCFPFEHGLIDTIGSGNDYILSPVIDEVIVCPGKPSGGYRKVNIRIRSVKRSAAKKVHIVKVIKVSLPKGEYFVTRQTLWDPVAWPADKDEVQVEVVMLGPGDIAGTGEFSGEGYVFVVLSENPHPVKGVSNILALRVKYDPELTLSKETKPNK